MIRYSHVLYCTDFSEEADMACHHALDFAQRSGAKLHVLHILHSPFKYWCHLVDEFVDAAEVVEEVSEAIVEKARTYLEEHYAYVLANLKRAVHERTWLCNSLKKYCFLWICPIFHPKSFPM